MLLSVLFGVSGLEGVTGLLKVGPGMFNLPFLHHTPVLEFVMAPRRVES